MILMILIVINILKEKDKLNIKEFYFYLKKLKVISLKEVLNKIILKFMLGKFLLVIIVALFALNGYILFLV